MMHGAPKWTFWGTQAKPPIIHAESCPRYSSPSASRIELHSGVIIMGSVSGLRAENPNLGFVDKA